jgi:hypothetical protein
MNASVKRIIWALGWYALWLVNDYLSFLQDGHSPTTSNGLFMLAIWIVPLILFKDDKKEGNNAQNTKKKSY